MPPRSREAGGVLPAAKIAAGVCLLNSVPVPRFLPSALIPHLLLIPPPAFRVYMPSLTLTHPCGSDFGLKPGAEAAIMSDCALALKEFHEERYSP